MEIIEKSYLLFKKENSRKREVSGEEKNKRDDGGRNMLRVAIYPFRRYDVFVLLFHSFGQQLLSNPAWLPICKRL
jgi:hypothetical protein